MGDDIQHLVFLDNPVTDKADCIQLLEEQLKVHNAEFLKWYDAVATFLPEDCDAFTKSRLAVGCRRCGDCGASLAKWQTCGIDVDGSAGGSAGGSTGGSFLRTD